jgi:CBS-domain-containing membrane protein
MYRVSEFMVTRPKTHGIETTIDEIRAVFADDDVRIVLVVDDEERLVTTVERSDVPAGAQGSTPAAAVGTRAHRTVRPGDTLAHATAALFRQRRRRLAVIDDDGRLVGLLCLKRDASGYCSDADVQQRALARRRAA